MNKAVETRTLTTKFKEALKGAKHCTIEIRTPIGNVAGERLQKSLSLADVPAKFVEVVATPHTGILIEASPKCAQIGLSIQTAFNAVGMEAHLLVQNTPREEIVIIHLNSASEPSKTPKK